MGGNAGFGRPGLINVVVHEDDDVTGLALGEVRVVDGGQPVPVRERDPFLARERSQYQEPLPRREFILQILEEQGVIGPADGARPREILLGKENNQADDEDERN